MARKIQEDGQDWGDRHGFTFTIFLNGKPVDSKKTLPQARNAAHALKRGSGVVQVKDDRGNIYVTLKEDTTEDPDEYFTIEVE